MDFDLNHLVDLLVSSPYSSSFDPAGIRQERINPTALHSFYAILNIANPRVEEEIQTFSFPVYRRHHCCLHLVERWKSKTGSRLDLMRNGCRLVARSVVCMYYRSHPYPYHTLAVRRSISFVEKAAKDQVPMPLVPSPSTR